MPGIGLRRRSRPAQACGGVRARLLSEKRNRRIPMRRHIPAYQSA